MLVTILRQMPVLFVERVAARMETREIVERWGNQPIVDMVFG
jgi:hypothetical protein